MSSNHRRTPPTPDSSRSGASEQRNSCRYPPKPAAAWLGWWKEQEFRQVAAEIKDISLRGCRLHVEELPPLDQPVWFTPSVVSETPWIESKVIAATKLSKGPRLVRIAFQRVFPYDLFKYVVYGPALFVDGLPRLWEAEGLLDEDDWV